MKFIKVLIIALAIPLHSAYSNDQTREKIVGNLVTKFLEQFHISNKKLGDDIAVKAMEQFLKKLDYRKQFFLQEDINALRKFEKFIDDQIQSGKLSIVTLAYQKKEKRMDQVQKYIDKYLKQPFDYKKSEKIETDPEKRDFLKTDKELEAFWRKSLKLSVLNEILAAQSEQEALKETNKKDKKKKDKKDKKEKKKDVKPKTFAQIEKEAREKVKNDFESYFKRIKKLKRIDKTAVLINSIIAVYDPHSQYLPPMDVEDFNINISGKLEGIGAVLSQDGPYTKVERIVPGSPSWKQKDLKPADVILKVGQSSEDPVSIVGMDLRDAVRLIRGKKGSTVKLTVKKADGTIKIVPIVRDVVELEDSVAKGTVLQHDKVKKKIGYISLPSFYRDFHPKPGEEAKNCTDDVRKLLEQLNSQKVSGLILDLRNNGGGSLPDAIQMAGLFFKDGPVVQVKNHQAAIEVHEDDDSEIVFDKPILVLQDSLSASASEIVSGALKDYGRAVVVGTPQTHGKGTVQTIIDLDRQVGSAMLSQLLGIDAGGSTASYGALKLTIQKFFRINGSSTQKKGVDPHIALPDPYEFIENGERHLDYALEWEKIPKAKFKAWKKTKYPVSKLISKSKKRVKKSKRFATIKEKAKLMKKYTDSTVRDLTLATLEKDQKVREKELKKYEEEEDIKELKIVSHLVGKLGKKKISKENKKRFDESQKARQEEFEKKLKKDIYLEEAVLIMNDILNS